MLSIIYFRYRFCFLVPMASKGEFPQALQKFCKKIGVPRSLVCDPSGEQSSKEVKKYCNNVALPLCLLEEGTQHANLSEKYIGLFKTVIANGDISHLCVFGFFSFVMHRDHTQTFPDEKWWL